MSQLEVNLEITYSVHTIGIPSYVSSFNSVLEKRVIIENKINYINYIHFSNALRTNWHKP